MLPCFFSIAMIVAAFAAGNASGAEPEKVRQQLTRGEYAEVIRIAQEAIGSDELNEEWRLILGEALFAVGRYAEAREVLVPALEKFRVSLRLRLLAYHVLRHAGDVGRAEEIFIEMDRLGGTREWAYRTPEDRIALGKIALLVGADPKRVLELFFDPVKKAKPEFRESYLACGQLALDKNDFALASKFFGEAARKFPEDPDAHFGLAQAFAPSDTETMGEELEKTLKFNPNHPGARLLGANHLIDTEQYEAAESMVADALKLNPADPKAHAYRAVIAHLRADAKSEKEARDAALKSWANNPEVDHLIGRKLSQKYRFAEGAQRQRLALKFDPAFLPARMQLAQDLLRLGEETEGWKLVEEVQKADPYDVVAFNLVTLKESISHFQKLANEHFEVRMDPREAAIYGDRVLALLERARATLTKKYGLEPKEKTIVEIFPDQKDFAIRTFGLPGGDGYLGVCFGRLITANSPASRPNSPSNWEAVLWHEFCHVVTL
ncbi:MAG: tetratricopeptide repeat protein, partial [Verrucomicrobiota bacterium]|nr:tetratricopeptide repeat protein [Verrucomicrobiota bacterium]